MSLSAIRVMARGYLDDEASSATGSTQRWSPSEIDRYINQAYKIYISIALKNSFSGIIKTAYLPTTAGSEIVVLPTDYLKTKILYKVCSSSDIPLKHKVNYERLIDNQGWSNSDGYLPSYDFELGSTGLPVLILQPKCLDATTTSFKLKYYPIIPNLVNDADEPIWLFRSQFETMLALKAAVIAKEGREEDDASGLKELLDTEETIFNSVLSQSSDAHQYVEQFNAGG